MAKQQGATPKQSPDGMSLFAALLVGVVLTLCLVLFVYLWNPFGQGKTDLSTENSPIVQPKNSSTVASSPTSYEFYDLLKEQQVSGVPNQAIASQPAPTNPRPDVVVTGKATAQKTETVASSVDETSVENNQTTDTTQTDAQTTNQPTDKIAKTPTNTGRISLSDSEPTTTYILQINSFDNADDADRRRAEVLMAGVDAQIVKKRLPDDSMVYQVISRPMPNSQMAAQAQHRLQTSGIDSLIVEQRRK